MFPQSNHTDRTVNNVVSGKYSNTVKLVNKEKFDKEQICIKEPLTLTNLPFTS